MTRGPRKARAVRVEDNLWQAAQATAAERGDILSEVIREALKCYVVEQEKIHEEKRAADLHARYERQISDLRRDLDHARAHAVPSPQPSPQDATEQTAPDKVTATLPATIKAPVTQPVRRARPRWHVVQLDEADAGNPDAVVVVMSTNASETAARNALSRMRSKHTGKDTIYYEVRPSTGIRRRLEWDPDKGRGIERNGPPA